MTEKFDAACAARGRKDLAGCLVEVGEAFEVSVLRGTQPNVSPATARFDARRGTALSRTPPLEELIPPQLRVKGNKASPLDDEGAKILAEAVADAGVELAAIYAANQDLCDAGVAVRLGGVATWCRLDARRGVASSTRNPS